MGSENLAKEIKKAREKAKLTQAEVSSKAGIHTNYYARVERGEVNPSYEILEKIAKALQTRFVVS